MGPSGAPMLSDRRKATVRIGSTWCKNVKNWTFFRFDYEYQNLIRFPVQAASCLALMMIPNKIYVYVCIYIYIFWRDLLSGERDYSKTQPRVKFIVFHRFHDMTPRNPEPFVGSVTTVLSPVRRFPVRFAALPGIHGSLMVCANQCFCVKDSLRSMRFFLEKNQICRE